MLRGRTRSFLLPSHHRSLGSLHGSEGRQSRRGGAGVKRGRKPDPTALRLLRGNPGRRPLPTNEPQPPDASVEPPAWLDETAKVEWRRVATMLSLDGVLTEMDSDALCAYCETWVRWKEATAKIRQFGMVIKSPNGMPMPSPYVA